MKSVCVFLVIVFLASCGADYIACKRQTGCLCVTDDFTIDISKAFKYPINITDPTTDRGYTYTFSCEPNVCDPSKEATTAICQYDPEHNTFTNCGQAGEAVWTVINETSFTIEYHKGDQTYKGSERHAKIEFVVADVKESSFGYVTQQNSDSSVLVYVFGAEIRRKHRPSPFPPSPHCYTNNQLVLIIGATSVVSIVLFSIMIAAIVAIVVWCSGKGHHGKKSHYRRFSQARDDVDLKKSYAL